MTAPDSPTPSPEPPFDGCLADLRRRRGEVPGIDPSGPGTAARLLIVLETPGRNRVPGAPVTLDAPTGTARNLRAWLGDAGIDRGDVLLWNAVPWVIHAPGARTLSGCRVESRAG